MYLPTPFQETDASIVKTLMATYPLATLVLSTEDGLLADHIPLILKETVDGQWLLQGHVARGNAIWRQLPATALVIFQGPDSYISPNWYPSKQRDGKAVPTWNYVALHLQGELRAVDDVAWLRDALTRLTDSHEQPLAQTVAVTRPWQLTDAPTDYLERMLKAVVGIEFTVRSWQCKAKVSQNQAAENQQGVVDGLMATATSGQQAVGQWVQQRIKA